MAIAPAILREALSMGAFTTFTSMFMHADLWHLLGNMIFLWAFGRRLEDACGPWRYLLFYLFAGWWRTWAASCSTRWVWISPASGPAAQSPV